LSKFVVYRDNIQSDQKQNKSSVLEYLVFCFIETFVLHRLDVIYTGVLLVAYSLRLKSDILIKMLSLQL
jgi:hypothetical protein